MVTAKIRDVNVVSEKIIPTPAEVKEKLQLSDRAKRTVIDAREAIEKILERRDRRFFVIVGPCSIHDIKAAEEYAAKLKTLADEVRDTLLLIMRVYFSKPRTTIGWKGLINDPFLDDSFRIDEGLHLARKFLLRLAEIGLPAATEALDPIVPQYLDDLIAWHAIGARTTESQTHREMASGLSTAVGIKNGTDGNIQVAINALKSVSQPHHFLGINQEGQCTVLQTRGNRYGHIVLRGGKRPNYHASSIKLCEEELSDAGLPVNIVVDCSHGNSLKDAKLQPLVMEDVLNQIIGGNQSIVGLMLESSLFSGSQPLTENLSDLRYGVSITDACIDWETTESLIRSSAEKLRCCLKE